VIKNIDHYNPSILGLLPVKSLKAQIDGNLELDKKSGTTYKNKLRGSRFKIL